MTGPETDTAPLRGRRLHSTLTGQPALELSLASVEVPPPAPDEIVVRVEATPINPSDLGLLLGPADPASFARQGEKTVAPIAPARGAALAARRDQALPVGNEGAGTVVRAGVNARHLLGRTVALAGGAMYADYRTVPAAQATVLPEGVTAAQGASITVNPLTALSMVETLRAQGHTALVHTAAASNLGQMLVRVCRADGVPLVNIVRSAAQAALLAELGAEHVLDSSAADFGPRLVETLAATGATLAFDAVGGGPLAGQILGAMEIAASRGQAYSRYGSSTHKQVYVYGRLDLRPTELPPNAGMAWGVGGYLLTAFLASTPPARVAELRKRVLDELTTTFASHYTRTIGLADLLDPDVIRAYARRATGEKFLVDPRR